MLFIRGFLASILLTIASIIAGFQHPQLPVATSSMPRLLTTITTSSGAIATSSVTFQNAEVRNPIEQTRITSISSNEPSTTTEAISTATTTSSISCGSLTEIQDINGNSTGFSKDKCHVYYDIVSEVAQTSIVAGANPSTFLPIPQNNPYDIYFSDGEHVYTKEGVLVGAHPTTFQILYEDSEGFGYAKDSNHVYTDLYIIQGADPATFMVLSSLYSKDQNHVFYPDYGTAILVPGADPGTFKVLSSIQQCGNGCYFDAEDDTQLYFQGLMVQYSTIPH